MKPATQTDRSASSRWISLQDGSHLPDIQEVVRGAIRQEMVRVVPGEDGRVRIIPQADSLVVCTN